ncbi:Asp-tRNA(Asn)/Glu-tRNA(Gln) amidotransferase subunit GatC [Clostridium thermarum]|uniref:Asp-tRNA(Asn)/Glu-tRNA(Gln) amidotransferase subunit GatC n=1 Tax=Clostridium thermarum TaxID=1716543 RepID=UPI00111CC006|nr:Asp-tRNA(Asn)/Glu-tRNA(Gln) amidotransferase subunit GatC [Clostridium thermarum]
MNISTEEVNRIAKLAKLKFSEAETIKLTSEFEKILEHFHSMDKLALDDIDLHALEKGAQTSLRKDEVEVFEDKESLFVNAKTVRDRYIEVPKIIE